MSNVLSEEKKQQVITLGRLGWSLRKIQKATGVHRTTAADYLRAAGIALRPPGAWGKATPAKPANEAAPDSGSVRPAAEVSADPLSAKPANGVTPDFGAELAVSSVAAAPALQPGRSPSASACEPYREAIEVELSKGRNAKAIWQDLGDRSGFAGGYQSVKRFVRRFLGQQSPEACAVIETAPGEESQVDYGTGPMVRDSHTGSRQHGVLQDFWHRTLVSSRFRDDAIWLRRVRFMPLENGDSGNYAERLLALFAPPGSPEGNATYIGPFFSVARCNQVSHGVPPGFREWEHRVPGHIPSTASCARRKCSRRFGCGSD
jgi:hypothetical protein